MSRRLPTTVVHLLLLSALCIAAYLNTLHVPFILDDRYVIVDNPITHDLGYFSKPWLARQFQGHFEYPSFRMRFMAYLTFAGNYALHGLELPGYHVVNIICHLLTVCIVYSLIVLLWRTPALRPSNLSRQAPTLALIIAGLFAVHPLQTAAVTYIWQRVAVLCGLFYLATIAAYGAARLSAPKGEAPWPGVGSKTGLAYYLLALICCLAVSRTKENAVTLPFTLLAFELLLFQGPLKKRLLFVLPFFVVMANLALSVVEGTTMDAMHQSLSSNTMDAPFARTPYLLTQFRVVATYLQLLLLPVGQRLIYDTPLTKELHAPAVWGALMLHLTLIGGAMGLLLQAVRQRIAKEWLLVAVGVLWFYWTIAIESSVFPLIDLVFEHRVYLPSVGLITAVVISIVMIVSRLYGEQVIRSGPMLAAALPVLAVLLATTIVRNTVWASEESIWQDSLTKSPAAAMANYEMGMIAAKRQEYGQAIPLFRQAAILGQNSQRLACQVSALNNLGNSYFVLGQLEQAKESWRQAYRTNPDNYMVLFNLGMTEDKQGHLASALAYYRQFSKRASPPPAEVIARIRELEESLRVSPK